MKQYEICLETLEFARLSIACLVANSARSSTSHVPSLATFQGGYHMLGQTMGCLRNSRAFDQRDLGIVKQGKTIASSYGAKIVR